MTPTARRRQIQAIGLALAMGLTLVACGGSGPPKSGAKTPNLDLAPESARVDRGKPAFTNATKVTNPLYPVATVSSVLMLGQVDGRPFRVEVTLLPGTKTIEWNGQKVPTLISQYAAYSDGRIHEVALDWYAQADDGAVWYFGEDVFNYERGVVADTDGTWLAGKDGPAGMIMAGQPKVGDVWRPENIPGAVFEEVTVKSIGQSVPGPAGSVAGAIITSELHMDGSRESKTFAPGYGEFSTGSGEDLEAVALAVPTDALTTPAPPQLSALLAGTAGVFDAAGTGDWSAVSKALSSITSSWNALAKTSVPPMIAARMKQVVADLSKAASAQDVFATRLSALDIAQSALDLKLRNQLPHQIDLARFELWTRMLELDTGARDIGAVSGDVATLEWIRDRIAHTLTPADAARVAANLRELRGAVEAKDLTAASTAGNRLRATIKGLKQKP